MSDRVPPDQPLPTRTEAEGATVDIPEGLGFFTTGQVLGDRYEILEMLGRGGMGEVWRAFDLKLRVEVALKALRDDLFQDERRLELLRQEVRAAREVVSPNVCRIFDLHEFDGRELVSMEYVDGATLLGVLQERGPLELKEAQDIASQFLSGLEAIHKAGLVHRDVKPENIMLTRAGRVVVMDFGLARGPESGAGSVSGTPAYMAPEHAAGQDVDARADVYSAGVVLAEMVSPEGIKSYESRQSVWQGVRSEPAQVPDSPWAPVIQRAVARDRERRPNSAHTLIRELEDVTLRVEGAEDLHPYPGLSSFTKEDAEYFFGREAEIEAVWRRLESAHLLAIVGPSGAGKSSFIEAGLRPNAPSDWRIARCTPGNAAVASLRRSLIRELTGDAEALERLVDSDTVDSLVEAAARWRRAHGTALVIVDQFEELFTQNPDPEQARFATLIGRLVVDADVRILLSMRDDFLLHCNRHEGLRPLFASLTPLDPPTGGALRRAVTQPALKCGYRFEDDELVEEILAEVEGERGALPMLAFAVSRLWEKRDRDQGLLTRQAYGDIGGVGGALARHAEATVDRIGIERIPIVRELFRNLVTAEGTRAVREWGELLSVFDGGGGEGIKPSPTKTPHKTVGEGFIPSRDAAAEVLAELIDARLLTSYEVRIDEHEPTRRVEIIHESLLANWPRLVRWQTQDADAVQLRDQLRQAARTWGEHERSDDLLWTGSAYREYTLWRERYPGGLTEIEEAFAVAMTSLATRRKRRRRLAIASAFTLLLLVLAVVGSFWRRSVLETRRAEAETKRAEAQKLLALGQLVLETDPTEALAWARASLEVADTRGGRMFAMRALANGPVARAIRTGASETGVAHQSVFSPDGEWVALRGYDRFAVFHRSGGPASFVDTFPTMSQATIWPFFDSSGRGLGAHKAGELRIYEMPGFTEIERHRLERAARFPFPTDRGTYLVSHHGTDVAIELVQPGSPPELVLTIAGLPRPALRVIDFDAAGKWASYTTTEVPRAVYLQYLEDPSSPPRRVHILDEPIERLVVHPEMEWFAVHGRDSDTISLWSFSDDSQTPLRTFEARGLWVGDVDPEGRRLVGGGKVDGNRVAIAWDLNAPAGAEPLMLRWQHRMSSLNSVDFDPSGRWVAAGGVTVAPFWPLPQRTTVVFKESAPIIFEPAFTPGGSALMIPGRGGMWLRSIEAGGTARRLIDGMFVTAVVDPQGEFAIASRNAPSGVILVPLDGSEASHLAGIDPMTDIGAVAYDPERNLVAAGVVRASAHQKVIHVWDLGDGSHRVLGPSEGAGESWVGGYWGMEFLPDGSLLTAAREESVRRWNLEDGSSELLHAGNCTSMSLHPDGDTALVGCGPGNGTPDLLAIDIQTTEVHVIESGIEGASGGALSPRGDVLAIGFEDGSIQVKPLEGGESHHLLGHQAAVNALVFSPDGSLLATGGLDGTIRVWPVPDVSKAPLQALPHDALMAKLDTFTNLRVVRDEASPTGWRVELGPFPGWETVPEW